MNAFQAIPPKVRTTLYLAYSLVALFLGGCQVINVDDLWGFPVIEALALLAYVGAAFGFTAAANVSSSSAATITAPATVEVTGTDDDAAFDRDLDDSDLVTDDDGHAGD